MALELQHRRRPFARLDRAPLRHRSLGCDFDNSGPLEVEGKGEFPPADAVWNTCTKYRIELKYPRDIIMIIAGGHPDIRGGTSGSGRGLGWVNAERLKPRTKNGARSPPARKIAQSEAADFNQSPSQLPGSGQVAAANHHARRDGTPLGHSWPPGLIAMLVGRKLKWDAGRSASSTMRMPASCLAGPTARPGSWRAMPARVHQ